MSVAAASGSPQSPPADRGGQIEEAVSVGQPSASRMVGRCEMKLVEAEEYTDRVFPRPGSRRGSCTELVSRLSPA